MLQKVQEEDVPELLAATREMATPDAAQLSDEAPEQPQQQPQPPKVE